MIYEVVVAQYMGEGYWSDSPPYEFETRKEAEQFAAMINMSLQAGGQAKARDIIERPQ